MAGAGLAGSAAAWRLACRGFKVVLVERGSFAGGRAGSAPDPETGEPVDTGQHALMGCYSSALRWFREMGTAGRIKFQDRLEVPFAVEPPVVFRSRRLPPPLNLLGGIMGLPGMTSADWIKSLALGRAAFASRSLDKLTVAQWADRLGIPAPVRHWVLNPLALAALNEQPETGSAFPLARVMRRIARRGGTWSAMGWATTGFGDLYIPPVKNRVELAGGTVRTRAEIRGIIVKEGRTAGVRLSGGEEIPADAVILSLPPWDLVKVLEEAPGCAAIREKAGKLQPSPILTVHLWLDAGILDGPFLGLDNGPFDWVFNRTFMVGAARRGAQHLCLVRSGAREMLGRKPAELEELALSCLRSSVAGAKTAKVVHRRIVWETKGTVSLTPGTDILRPGARTPVPGLFLAGGWTATGYPDTIESAVISGMKAAALAVGLAR